MAAKILILDCDESERASLQFVLSEAGFVADIALSSSDVLERLRANGYDVLVLDIHVEEANGFDVLIRARDECPGVICVALASERTPDFALRALQEGAFDFVYKPVVEDDEFLHHVQRAVGHKRLRDSHARLVHELEMKNVELENRLSQLELAHSILQSQAVAIQVDLNRAMQIQRGLLPHTLPFSDRISVATAYHPVGKVGGDLYDFFALDEGTLGFYIADLSGHGISSAMLAVFLKLAVEEAVRLSEERGHLEPGAILRILNETVLNEAFGQGVFISLAFGILDMASMNLAFSSAGHPPILLRRADGTVERFRHPAPVLGVNPKVSYTATQVEVKAGDALVLYTDGVTDAKNMMGEFFEEERLRKVIAAAPPHAQDIVEQVLKEIQRFSEGRQQPDDITLLVLGAEPQQTPYEPPNVSTGATPSSGREGTEVTTAQLEETVFVRVAGSGSWRESQQVLELCERARVSGATCVVLDFAECSHLDSTFLGVLHNLAASFDKDTQCRLEIQGLPRPLLKDMSELGLTSVLLHFRGDPVPLPESMAPVEGKTLAREDMGRLLLWAHEALVDADASNADRFASVLKVLHDRVKGGDAPGGREDVS